MVQINSALFQFRFVLYIDSPELIVQPDHWEGDVFNGFVVILTDLSSARHYKVDRWQLLSVNLSSLALISMSVLFWKTIQHVQPEYVFKKRTCLTREGRKVPIRNGRCSLGSGSVVREKSIKMGETVREQRKEKQKWKKSRAERWTPSRLASLTENPSPPPPHHHYSATTFAVFCIPVSFWSDLDWFCCSVLTLRQNSKTSPNSSKRLLNLWHSSF